MANQEQHNGDQAIPQDAAEKPAFAGAARRRFATRGAAAVGAALTLKSTPGMAAGGFLPCLSPSGAVSGNISRQVACGTSGRSPGYYLNKPSRWPSTRTSSLCAPTNKFSDVFISSGSFATCSLNTMCSPQSFDKNNVARHIVASYLNARKGWTPYLPADKVKAIWEAYWLTGGPNGGYYIPPGTTTRWYGAQIVDYLVSTMDKS